MKRFRPSALRLALALVLAAALALFAWLPAGAQSSTAAGIFEQQRPIITELQRRTDQLAAQMDANRQNDSRLAELRLEFEQLAGRILEAGVAFRPRIDQINIRLEQLGPAADGASEPEVVANERAALNIEKAEINALIGEAETLSLRVNRLAQEIGVIRRDLFAETLSRRYDMSSALNWRTLEDFRTELGQLYKSVSSWLRFVVNFKLRPMLLATMLALGAAVFIIVVGRRMFGQFIDAPADREKPSYLARLSFAFWSTLLPTAALAAFLGATYYFYNYFNVLRADIAALIAALFQVVFIVFFVNRLARAALSPPHPQWRLLPIELSAGRLLYWLFWLTAVTTGVDTFMSRVNEIFGSPLSLTIAKSFVATVIVGLLLVAIALVKPFRSPDGSPQAWPTWFRWLLLCLGSLTIAVALLGYIGLARFMSAQIVVTGAILATMYIGFLSAGAVGEEAAFARTAPGRRLRSSFAFDDTTLDQFGLLASISIYVLIVALGIPLILLQWGFQWGDILAWSYSFASEFTVGSISFSLIGILTGILVFVAGYFFTRGFQNWLDRSVLSRGRMDSGVRNSIRTAIGYAGLALAVLIGISAAGINLSSLALIAGALSLGIGFGLQNVVSNFVSGLILLAERPFKVGDWIVAGPVEGIVRKISVRATEIETFRRQTMILPNSELINAAVGNWTHRNKLGRVEIRVGVAYGTDVRQVHSILMDIAMAHPLVLKNPEPSVAFVDFGDSALIFEMRMVLADVMNGVALQNEVRFAVVDAFERAGIVMPFPQRDLNVGRETIELLRGAPEASVSHPPARTYRRRHGRRRAKGGRMDPDDPQ